MGSTRRPVGLLAAVLLLAPETGRARGGWALPPSAEGSYVLNATTGVFEGDSTAPSVGVAITRSERLYYAYLVFDLRGVAGPVTSLTLSGAVLGLRGASDLPPYVDYRRGDVAVLEVTTPVADLVGPYPWLDPEGYQIWRGLGSGLSYGWFGVGNGITPAGANVTPVGPGFAVALDGRAVSDAEAARLGSGFFAVGLTMDPHGSPGGLLGDISGASLVVNAGAEAIPAPEPSLLVMAASGALTAGGYLARRRLRRPEPPDGRA